MKAVRRSTLLTACLALGLCLLAGCLEDRLVWSPDGRVALVIAAAEDGDGGGGAYLCDALGHLSPLLVPHVYQAAWLGDSQRVILARTREIQSTAELAAALGPARAQAIADKAELDWQRIQTGESLEQLSEEAAKLGDADLLAEVLYLRERHDSALQRRFGEDWRQTQAIPIQLHSLVLAKVDQDRVVLETTLRVDTTQIADLRPSPDDRAIAFTCGSPIQSGALQQLLVIPADGSGPAVVAAAHAGRYPDWSPDSRALVFLQSDSAGGDDLHLGTLARQEVALAGGRVALAGKRKDLAEVVFDASDRVRCLRDGRVLFAAPDVHFPGPASANGRHEQLFAVDLAGDEPVAPLIPKDRRADLPPVLAAFAVSPDEKQILLSSDSGDLQVLTLRSGKVEQLAGALNSGGHYPAAAWRKAGEFTYSAKISLATGKPALASDRATRNAIILRHGDEETVLSRAWTDEEVRRFLPDDKGQGSAHLAP